MKLAIDEKLYAGSIRELRTLAEEITDAKNIIKIREATLAGDVFIARKVIPRELARKIRAYLTHIGRSSLPNYQAIVPGAPNFHRLMRQDPRAYVQGCFHQFCFFPWNQDVFNFFELFAPIFHLKNLISELPAAKFMGQTIEDGCAARVAFQFYPRGAGYLNKHIDPVNHHQLSLPIMTLSQKGRDFFKGGAYVETAKGEQIYFDEICREGDVVFCSPQIVHGVDAIDPDLEEDWLAFEGRWMGLFAVNKCADNNVIQNSKDLGKT